ncbi:hypothetical protein QEK83_000114 [Stenotrophomonas maltophilia]|uniref:Uncharacterized protein n=1 Tax=Stenotrophomonas maltophilia TaxID=40324 RepID=A0AAI9C7J3_STEMA|nr:hypothetical protein [Stenotrophomonas maltophilia]
MNAHLLMLAFNNLDENAPEYNCLRAHYAIVRSGFHIHQHGLQKSLESGAKINPYDAATLLQMHGQAMYFGDATCDPPKWVSDKRWPTHQEQCHHLIDVVRRRQLSKLQEAISELQSDVEAPVKRRM